VLVVLGRNPTVRPRFDTPAVYCYLQSRNRLKKQPAERSKCDMAAYGGDL